MLDNSVKINEIINDDSPAIMPVWAAYMAAFFFFYYLA
jgi:hypothetical protein